MIVFDATNAVVGRLTATVAKKALAGEDVVVVNCEKALVTGDPTFTIAKYKARRGITQKANPEHAAKWPRRPDLLFKRIARGMLPKKKARGKNALRKIRVFVGVPKEFEAAEKQQSGVRSTRSKSISLLELCKRLGWRTTL